MPLSNPIPYRDIGKIHRFQDCCYETRKAVVVVVGQMRRVLEENQNAHKMSSFPYRCNHMKAHVDGYDGGFCLRLLHMKILKMTAMMNDRDHTV